MQICDRIEKKAVINTENSFKTEEFELAYVESEISDPDLWESHCHAQFEMIAVLEGDVTVMLEGNGYHLKKHQTIIIPPLCYHSITFNGSGSYHRVTALFERAAIPDVLQSAFLKNGDVAPPFSADAEKLKELCQKETSAFYAPLVKSLMVQIFYDAVRAAKSPAIPETDEFLQAAIFYIDRHLHEKISLEALAKHTSKSKSSFCHLFEEKMKISPKQYILQKKLALASKLIGEGVPPTLAAMRVGYEHYSNFYRIYCKQLGTSPTKRRR